MKPEANFWFEAYCAECVDAGDEEKVEVEATVDFTAGPDETPLVMWIATCPDCGARSWDDEDVIAAINEQNKQADDEAREAADESWVESRREHWASNG